MNLPTRRQLHRLSLAFYEAHAEAFDASRVDLPWPGWNRLLEALPGSALKVLDIGCGNGRFARFLLEAGQRFEYTGIDANETLLEAARKRIDAEPAGSCEWIRQDLLRSDSPGADLPDGEFSLVALMGVLHHVPGREWRAALLRAAARRLEPGGILALTAWQFAGRERFERRQVDWSDLPRRRSLGAEGEAESEDELDRGELEPGDFLLRFGDDPSTPPRYCHQVSDEEFASWPDMLGLEPLADFRADGAQGDLNRYWLLRRAWDVDA